jgi:DNA-binding MarR family transcriptional regulator
MVVLELSNLRELPPSVKFVLKVIEEHGQVQFAQLLVETRLPRRTVSAALAELRKAGLITVRPCFKDLRRKVYCYTLLDRGSK